MNIGCDAPIRITGPVVLLGLVGCFDPFSYGPRAQAEPDPNGVTYERDVYPILLEKCSGCHETGSSGGSTGFVLSSDAGDDYDTIGSFVTPGDPGESVLLQKASGAATHSGGGHLLPETSEDYQTIAEWVEQGAARQ